MKKALSAVAVFVSFAAHAQGTGEMYVAPGMAVHVARPRPAAPPKSTELPIPLAVLPRFWHSANDTTRTSGYAHLIDFIRYTTKYPETAKSIFFEGKVYVRAIVPPSGEPTATEIINRKKQPDHYIRAAAALEAESIRVVQAMRFQPQIGRADTIVVPLIYHMP
jgi:hypothetical protein